MWAWCGCGVPLPPRWPVTAGFGSVPGLEAEDEEAWGARSDEEEGEAGDK